MTEVLKKRYKCLSKATSKWLSATKAWSVRGQNLRLTCKWLNASCWKSNNACSNLKSLLLLQRQKTNRWKGFWKSCVKNSWKCKAKRPLIGMLVLFGTSQLGLELLSKVVEANVSQRQGMECQRCNQQRNLKDGQSKVGKSWVSSERIQ